MSLLESYSTTTGFWGQLRLDVKESLNYFLNRFLNQNVRKNRFAQMTCTKFKLQFPQLSATVCRGLH